MNLTARTFSSRRLLVLLFCILFALGVCARIAPHRPMVAPVAASALFIAFVSGRAWTGLLLAPLTLFIGDLFLGFYELPVMTCVYVAAAVPALFRRWLGQNVSISRLIACSLASSLIFFLLTNFAVWASAGAEASYPKTLSGLLSCYSAGVPFLRYTAVGDLAWTGAFFGLYALASSLNSKAAAARLTPAEASGK